MTQEKTLRQLLIEKDEVSLVQEDGTFIGPFDKYEAHKYPSKLHMAISVWLFNSKGEVLFQQRSKKKIVGADWWANTVCGNLWPTETYFDCANRRLKYELGISGVQIKPIYKFSYKAYGNETYGEHELDQVYVSLIDGVSGSEADEPVGFQPGSAVNVSNSNTLKISPNPDEVSDSTWVNFEELYTQVSTYSFISPEESLLLDAKDLKEKTQPVLVTVGGKELLIAPWTIFMLKNTMLFDEFKKVLTPNLIQ